MLADAMNASSGSASLGLADTSTSGRYSFTDWKILRPIFVGIAFFISTFLLLPTTLYLLLGDYLQIWHISILYLILFLGIFISLSKALSQDNRYRAQVRRIQKERLEVIDGTYRCISPQILGSAVVFPIVVKERSADRDGICVLGNERLEVRLEQGGAVGPTLDWKDGEEGLRMRASVMQHREKDTVDRIKSLLHTSIQKYNQSNAIFEIKIFSGSGAGPTGLSAGVISQGYGATLAAYVGACLERECSDVQAAPPIRKTS